MISRARWVSIASIALLTVASACLAAEPETGAVPGRGGIGGQLGASYFGGSRLKDQGGTFAGYKVGFPDWSGEYSLGAEPRFSFSSNFRYVMSRRLRWQVSPGFLWAAYKNSEPVSFRDPNFPNQRTKDTYLTLLLPLSAQLQVVRHGRAWLWHLGMGPGLYRLWVENHRKVLKDPVSLKLHRALYPGATAEFGAEHFLKQLPSTSIELVMDGHLALSQDDKRYVSGLNSNVFAMGFRVGANYYFPLQKPKASRGPAVPGAGR